MHLRVVAHALLTVAIEDPGGVLDLTVPAGCGVRRLLEILHERSPVFDPRATPIVLVDGRRVPLNRPLEDGAEVHLYPISGGG